MKLGVPRRDAPDTRLLPIIQRIDERPQDFERLDDAARLAGLSPSWFQTLFRRAVGMPFRRYRLWRRMTVVMQAIAGAKTSQQPHMAPASQALLTLAPPLGAMFGLAPSDLLKLASRSRSDLRTAAGRSVMPLRPSTPAVIQDRRPRNSKPAMLSWATVRVMMQERDRSRFNHAKSTAELVSLSDSWKKP